LAYLESGIKNMKRTRLSAVGLLFFVTIVSVACSGCEKKGLQVVPVHGRVTMKGQPLTHGDVSFNPLTKSDKTPFKIATGRINPDGTYSLSTLAKDDGAMPGEYAVTIIYAEKRKSSDPLEYAPPLLTPEKYVKAEATPLRASVPAGSSPMTLDFKIEDK
jgi:hypothetical protein